MYVVTNSKSTALYEQMIDKIVAAEPRLNPQSIALDYEIAAVTAFRTKFPGIEVHGCLFHLAQCLYRKIQALGLTSWYRHPDNAMAIKRFLALAFVPEQEMLYAYGKLQKSMSSHQRKLLLKFSSYFERQWLGTDCSQPLVEKGIWNVYRRVLERLPRTTNSVEGWHRAFECRMRIANPTLKRLIQKLRLEQSSWEMSIAQLEGPVSATKKKKYVDLDQRIRAIVVNYNAENVVEYLHSIAYNL